MGPQPGSWVCSLGSESGKIMHRGSDSALRKEGASRVTARKSMELLQTGRH